MFLPPQSQWSFTHLRNDRSRTCLAGARVSDGVARTTRASPPPRPQGQRSSPAARSTLRIVCLQFIGWCAAVQRSHSTPLCWPPPAVNSNCIMAGLVAFWIPIGVDCASRGGLRQNRYALCVRSTNTRRVVVLRAYARTHACVRVSRTLIGTICLIGIIVSVDGDDRAANWNQMTRDTPRQWWPLCAVMHGVSSYTYNVIDLVTVAQSASV